MIVNTIDEIAKINEKLTGWYYSVILPELASRTKEDIRSNGVLISGDKDIDKDTFNRTIKTMLTIKQMLEHFKRGVPIRVVLEGDTKDIYNTIQAYINAWKYKLERGINIGNAPLDDLIALDELANIVYEPAKYHIKKEETNSVMATQFNKINTVNPGNFFNNKYMRDVLASSQTNGNVRTENGITRINASDEFEEREQLGDFFKNRIINRRR